MRVGWRQLFRPLLSSHCLHGANRVSYLPISPLFGTLLRKTLDQLFRRTCKGFLRFSHEATYVGPMLGDSALQRRLTQRDSTASGAIDVYNVWTSFQKVKLKNNFTITGHSYQICQDLHNTMYFASLIFAADGPIELTSQHKLKGGPTLECSGDIPTIGFWIVTCGGSPRNLRPNFYKVTSTYRVSRGGSGSGKETAMFDLFAVCR